MVAAAAKATEEGGGGAEEETSAIVFVECGVFFLTLSTTISAPEKAGAIPAQTMKAEAEAEAAAVARRIATSTPPPGGGLQSYRISPTLAAECSTLHTATALALLLDLALA